MNNVKKVNAHFDAMILNLASNLFDIKRPFDNLFYGLNPVKDRAAGNL
ncbi:MAG: hypothetical protein U5R49_18520 [Deltaproteobacteria bacterium]|nr:hypothetical protein [Deltaproteobacteria bacterium]